MRRSLFWLALLALGAVLFVASYLPILNPPRCPSDATQMPDGSPCIVGSNIGAGLAWMLGIALALVGGLGLVGSLLVSLVRRQVS